MFWSHANNSQFLADRRLLKLYNEMYCIDRFHPPAETGTNRQVITLDRAGAKILDIDNFRKVRELPNSYKHHLLIGDFRIAAKQAGFSWGKKEEKVGPKRIDIYYPKHKLAVEIDRGTETRSTLDRQAKKYNRLYGKGITCVFITKGTEDRKDYFLDQLTIPNAGATFDDLDEMLNKMVNKFLK